MIRVLIVDDHALVRSGLTGLLATADDIEVVGEAGDGDEATRQVNARAPDVVLMDLSMPGADGIEATRAITAAHPDVHVVVLTSFADRDRILAALEAGAVGYLLKDAAPDDLMRAVRAAAEGDAPLDPRAARELLGATRDRGQSGHDLSPREHEVLVCLREGLPNKLIARRLGITEKTVKAHLTRVYQAIGVSDRTAAALWARDHGL